jgi:hypothetical protein
MTTTQQYNFKTELVDPRTRFEYERLNSEAGEIRLAVLPEGKESDDIVCWIIHSASEGLAGSDGIGRWQCQLPMLY